jgi:hypothetical protein
MGGGLIGDVKVGRAVADVDARTPLSVRVRIWSSRRATSSRPLHGVLLGETFLWRIELVICRPKQIGDRDESGHTHLTGNGPR